MNWLNLAVYFVPVLFIVLLKKVYGLIVGRVGAINAKDFKFVRNGFKVAFTLTAIATFLVVMELLRLYIAGLLFVQDILLFYFVLPFLMCMLFLVLCAVAMVVSSFFCMTVKKGERATDRKIYSFNPGFRAVAFVVTVLTIFAVMKYANYIYITYRVDSLKATEEELRKVYPRAIKFAPLYLDVLHLICDNQSCTPDLIRLYVGDIDNVKISESERVSILSSIIENPRTPMDILEKLSNYRDLFIIEKAKFYIKVRSNLAQKTSAEEMVKSKNRMVHEKK